ncbi:MAG: purine-nucleoside phosphorylase [Lachnoclostridium sp.]|nr:purine-nucleoside phosphorylase [Lachnoclostridium sp.]
MENELSTKKNNKLKMAYPTPHINAAPEDFAKTVLMPGDPLRSEFIAKKYLEDAKLVNNVRGVQGYTGYYKGKKVSVMASGMGMPSMAIYSYELFNAYDVDNIIRIGTAGGIANNVKLRDIVVAMGCTTNTNYIHQFDLPGDFAPLASFDLMRRAVSKCEEMKVPYHVGNIFSSDVFYSNDSVNTRWNEMGILAVEMETAALYFNAAKSGKNAVAICTVSDHVIRGEALSAEERQVSFTEMMDVALETAISL